MEVQLLWKQTASQFANWYWTLWLVIRHLRPRNFLYALLDLLEWYCYWTVVYWWSLIQWAYTFVRLARECRWLSKASYVLFTPFQFFSLILSYVALCNDDPNGNVPLGKSCNRYWQCQGGYPRLQRCPAMLVFDRRSLRCVVPPTEDCDVPSTLPPPPLEEDDETNIPQNNPKNKPQFNLPPGAIAVPEKNRPRN